MKNKWMYSFLIIGVSIITMLSLGLNIYFYATKPESASGIFNACKCSVVEVKAQTNNIGTSFGTAELILKDGVFVTNAHIITYSKAGDTFVFEEIWIRFVDEQAFRSVMVQKYDLNLDIAVLKLASVNKTLKPIKIGNSQKLSAGEDVFSIGNLSNYGLSISKGIVSAPLVKLSYNNTTRDVIQCDLTISDGNSGGALINDKGELVGITTFRLKDATNNIIYGISYCIPINIVMEYIASN